MKIRNGVLISINKSKDIKRGACIIPNSVTSIGNYAFYGCSGLTTLTIPNSVTSIGYAAFSDCRSLTTVVIPDSVTSIGNYAFYNCTSLTSITISDTVTRIGVSAFRYCSKLILPVGIERIKAVKGFILRNGKLKCKGFNFEVGKEYKEDFASLCVRGFHACTNGRDVFNYYSGSDVVYYEVELSGINPDRGDDSKICGTTIELLRKLTVAEAANYRSAIVE